MHARSAASAGQAYTSLDRQRRSIRLRRRCAAVAASPQQRQRHQQQHRGGCGTSTCPTCLADGAGLRLAAMCSVLPRRQYGLPFPADPPDQPGLHADEQTIETMLSPEYWRQICPALTVDGASSGGKPGAAALHALEVDPAELAALRQLLDTEGHFSLAPDCFPWPTDLMERLARGVVQLMQNGWPAAFIAMYDEAWWVCNTIDALMTSVTGGNRNNMDFLAWYRAAEPASSSH